MDGRVYCYTSFKPLKAELTAKFCSHLLELSVIMTIKMIIIFMTAEKWKDLNITFPKSPACFKRWLMHVFFCMSPDFCPVYPMPHFPHVCFLWQAEVQEDVPEVRLAAGSLDLLFDLLLLLISFYSFPPFVSSFGLGYLNSDTSFFLCNLIKVLLSQLL